jgi:hypothetical protein
MRRAMFGFKPKRRSSIKKSNKVGTRMIKGVKRTVYKGKKGGKFYKKADGRKVYFGKKTLKKNTRFGNHGNARLDHSVGPYPMMFASHDPRLI